MIALAHLINRATATQQPLALFYVDLEKAFDMVPHDQLIRILGEYYHLDSIIVETIKWIYTDVWEQAVGHDATFGMAMGVK